MHQEMVWEKQDRRGKPGRQPCQEQTLLFCLSFRPSILPSLDCSQPLPSKLFLLALPVSEARQMHGCPLCLLADDQVTLSE